MEQKLTGWYPPEIKPVRPGVYEMEPGNDTLFGGSLGRFQTWNGEHWCAYGGDVDTAARQYNRSEFQHRRWRGLAEPPK